MLRGLWTLTWLEIKIFVREPLGLIGTVALPVLIFVVFGRVVGPRGPPDAAGVPRCVIGVDLPILAALLIAIEHRAVAGRDHRDLPRGRHSQAPAGDAAAARTRS